MSKFNKKASSSKTTNYVGAVAYRHGAEMELITTVLSSFLEDSYYEKKDDRIERIKKLIAECKPEFVAKLAVLTRRDFHMRSASHILLGCLASIHKGDDLVRRAMKLAIERPDDLIEIVSYLNPDGKKKIKSHQILKGIRYALREFNEYQLAKYKNDSKNLKLVDLFNATHPKPMME